MKNMPKVGTKEIPKGKSPKRPGLDQELTNPATDREIKAGTGASQKLQGKKPQPKLY